MKIKVAIIDTNIEYLKKITKVIENNYADKLQLFCFSNVNIALEGIKANKADIVLVDIDTDIDFKELPNRCGYAYFTDSIDIKTYKDIRCVCKFQKVEHIYKDLLGVYAEKAASSDEQIGNNNFNSKIISFFSVSGGVGGSAMAAAYAKSRVRKGIKTLYINLEKTGNVEIAFQGNGNGDLSDILYSIKSKKSNIRLKLESNVKTTFEGLYFYDSCNTAYDLSELSKDEIKEFFNMLSSSDLFDLVVVDADLDFDEICKEIIKRSKKIILVGNGSEISNAKLAKTITALSIMEEQLDMNIFSRVLMIYNKFRSRTGKVVEDDRVKVIGGVSLYENAEYIQVIEEISKLGVLDEI